MEDIFVVDHHPSFIESHVARSMKRPASEVLYAYTLLQQPLIMDVMQVRPPLPFQFNQTRTNTWKGRPSAPSQPDDTSSDLGLTTRLEVANPRDLPIFSGLIIDLPVVGDILSAWRCHLP